MGPADFAALRLGLSAVRLGLFLIAAPTMLRAAGVHAVADACHRALGPMLPGGAVTGWTASVAAVSLLSSTWRVRRRSLRMQRDTRVEPWLGEHKRVEGGDLVLLPTNAVVAYATPGIPAQVVVSRGLAASLSPEEFDAVIRHELAHVRNGHGRLLVLTSVLDATLGWLPGVRASTGALRLSVERWADEEAAEHPGARDSVRLALLRTTESMLAAVPAFTAGCTLLPRLDALQNEPPKPSFRERAILVAPVGGLAVVIAGSLVQWSTQTHYGFPGLIGLCPL